MTANPGTHLDLDALADVLAGEGDRTHVDGCAECTAKLAELEAAVPLVTATLAAAPTPAEPADLGDRMSRALEQAHRPVVADVVPLVPKQRTRWLPALGAVAAAAVLVTGGILVAQGGSGSKHAKTPAVAAATGSSPIPTSTTGINYTAKNGALSAELPALLRGHATEARTQNDTLSAVPKAAPAFGAHGDPLATLHTTHGLASCLAAVLDPGSTELPLALDYAAYNGQPALLILLADPRPDHVQAFFVGAGCSQADAQVLFFTRLPKP